MHTNLILTVFDTGSHAEVHQGHGGTTAGLEDPARVCANGMVHARNPFHRKGYPEHRIRRNPIFTVENETDAIGVPQHRVGVNANANRRRSGGEDECVRTDEHSELGAICTNIPRQIPEDPSDDSKHSLCKKKTVAIVVVFCFLLALVLAISITSVSAKHFLTKGTSSIAVCL